MCMWHWNTSSSVPLPGEMNSFMGCKGWNRILKINKIIFIISMMLFLISATSTATRLMGLRFLFSIYSIELPHLILRCLRFTRISLLNYYKSLSVIGAFHPRLVKAPWLFWRWKKMWWLMRLGEGGRGVDEGYPPPCVVWNTLLAPVNANKWESELAAAMRYNRGHDRHYFLGPTLAIVLLLHMCNTFLTPDRLLVSDDESVQWTALPCGNVEALKIAADDLLIVCQIWKLPNMVRKIQIWENTKIRKNPIRETQTIGLLVVWLI